MRTLKFIVEGQIIKPDPECDFSNIVPGTEDYLEAEFQFSSEWTGYVKVAAFWSIMGREYPPSVLTDGKKCTIPAEALKRRSFKMSLVGKNGTSKITTNKIEITQDGGV